MSQISPESEYAPYQPPADQRPQKNITTLRAAHVFEWLAMGWRDMRASMGISAFYGFSFWMMAVVLGAVFRSNPEYVMSIASGCLLVGPLLAMGLYDVSRRREQGREPELGASLTCWDANLRSVSLLLLVLMVLELLWGRASLVVFAVFFNTGMPSTTSVIQAVFNPENWEFLLAYTVVEAHLRSSYSPSRWYRYRPFWTVMPTPLRQPSPACRWFLAMVWSWSFGGCSSPRWWLAH